jgi:hypothetical protein
VVDCREVTEEPIESNRIRGVEGCGPQGINLTGGVLEALSIPARENYLGPFCTCTTCRFESDASATADDHNGLPKERRFTVDGRGISDGAHGFFDSASILLATLPAVRKKFVVGNPNRTKHAFGFAIPQAKQRSSKPPTKASRQKSIFAG